MQTNNHQIADYDLVLDQKFGKEGTPERIKAEEDALHHAYRNRGCIRAENIPPLQLGKMPSAKLTKTQINEKIFGVFKICS